MTVKINVSEDGVVEVSATGGGGDFPGAASYRRWETARNDSNQGVEIAYHVLVTCAPVLDGRFHFEIEEDSVFFYVDGEEQVYWCGGDKTHQYQGAEVADCLRDLLDGGVEKAFLAEGAQRSRWK